MCAQKAEGYSMPLPSGMGIKHLQFASMQRQYSSQERAKPLSNPIKINEIQSVIAAVMHTYNTEYLEKHEDHLKGLEKAKVIKRVKDYKAYSRVDIPQDKHPWKPKEKQRFTIVLYKHTSVTLGAISSMLSFLGVDEGDKRHSQEHSYIFFLHRITKAAAEVFALYTNDGYRPIQKYTDYSFPNKIALRLLAPVTDRPHKESHKQILGSVVTADAIVRASEAYNPNQVGKVFTSYKAMLRDNASVRELEAFQNKDRKPAHVEFEIKQGVVKVLRSLSLKDFAFIFNIFAKISAGEATYQMKEGKRTKTQEQDDIDAFRIYKYYTLVADELKRRLNQELANEIAHDVETGLGQPNWELNPPKYSDFHCSTEFKLEITLPKVSSPLIIGPWEGARPTYRELIVQISQAVPNSLAAVLVSKVPRWKFCFRGRRGTWEKEKLLNSLTGMKFIPIGGQWSCYFHLQSQWYETTATLLKDVALQFRGLLADTLIEEGEPGYLDRPWEPTSKFWTVEKTAKYLDVTEKQLREACSKDVQWVSADGVVHWEGLEGNILIHPIVSRFNKEINKLLKGAKITQDEVNAVIGPKYGKVIWEELTKKRPIAQIIELTEKKKELVQVLNAFGWPDCFKNTEERLEKLAQVHYFTSDEGVYNEGYLYDVTSIVDGKPMPYSLKGSGWLVGDRITRGWGIEIFDVLHFTKPKDKTVYLYHVKDGFNHVVRDACSQIVNSARTIFDARQRSSKAGVDAETVLSSFFEEATKEGLESRYRKSVRQQMLAIGKEGFLGLFRERTIVFVYAFVDDRATDYQLRREKIKKEQFTEADFTSEKTKDVAKAIFEDLKRGEFLGESGGKGAQFSSLYKVENLTFTDKKLSKHREFVWDILIGGIGHFSSLIARMDLLQTKREIEGMGFGFKVCQIKRPYNLKGGVQTPPSTSWDNIDEDLSQTFQSDLMAEGPRMYYNLWTETTEAWSVKPTRGDGSCGFHALFGEFDEEQRIYCCADVGQLRKDIAQELRFNLNPEGTAFTNLRLQKLYEANLRSLAQEAVRPLDGLEQGSPEHVLRSCAGRLFTDGARDVFKKYREKSQKFKAKVGSILENASCKESGVQMKAVREKLGEGKNFKKADACQLLSTRGRDIFEAVASIKAERSYAWMEKEVESAKKALDALEPTIQNLVNSAAVMANFLNCIEDPSYWLSDDELQLVADLRNLRVEVIRRDPSSPDGDCGCNNFHSQLPQDGDDREKVVVHGSDNHYSRCELFK